MAKDVIMPALGMTQETGVLLKWLKAEGDKVKKGEPLILVETDKTSVEVDAPASGILVNVIAKEGDEFPVGARIAMLVKEGEDIPELSAVEDADKQSDPAKQETKNQEIHTKVTPLARSMAQKENIDLNSIDGPHIGKKDVLAAMGDDNSKNINSSAINLASPKARRLAQENNLDLSEILGSGPEGSILADDVMSAAHNKSADVSNQPTEAQNRIRQIIAKRLTESWQTIPHFYLDVDVNMERMNEWHAQIKSRSDIKITITDLLVKLVSAALKRHPVVNAQWAGNGITYNEEINIGFAVAVEEGLQVPVIHDANKMGLKDIAARRMELVSLARDNSLPLADVIGGTFTISNLGMFGINNFCAIINPPQAAILAVGNIEDRVVAENGQAVVRKRMNMTLSCDHRVIDGADGAKFMQTLTALIEDPLQLVD